MDIKINPCYEKEPLLIRYACLLFNSKAPKNPFAQKLVGIGNQ